MCNVVLSSLDRESIINILLLTVDLVIFITLSRPIRCLYLLYRFFLLLSFFCKSFCKIIGGKLIEIDDQSEWDMIKRHVQGRRKYKFIVFVL